MNERNIPVFNEENIKRQLAQLECLTGKTIERHPASLDLISSVVMAYARKCGVVNDRPMK